MGGDRKGAGGGRRGGGKRDSQGSGNHEKLRKCLQFFVIFCNRNETEGTAKEGDGKREIQMAPPQPPVQNACYAG